MGLKTASLIRVPSILETKLDYFIYILYYE